MVILSLSGTGFFGKATVNTLLTPSWAKGKSPPISRNNLYESGTLPLHPSASSGIFPVRCSTNLQWTPGNSGNYGPRPRRIPAGSSISAFEPPPVPENSFDLWAHFLSPRPFSCPAGRKRYDKFAFFRMKKYENVLSITCGRGNIRIIPCCSSSYLAKHLLAQSLR
jgi:hypothetical protein